MKTCQINLVNSYDLRPNKINMMKTQKSILGYTITELLIVIALISIFAMAIVSSQNILFHHEYSAKVEISKLQIRISIEEQILSLGDKTNWKTLTTNLALAHCLFPSQTDVTKQCQVQTNTGLAIYDYVDNGVGSSGLQLTSAATSSPVYFDVEAKPCTTPSENCIFQTYASFSSKCKGTDDPCYNPTSVVVKYTIEQIPGQRANNGITIKKIESAPIAVKVQKHWDPFGLAKITMPGLVGNHFFCGMGYYSGGPCRINYRTGQTLSGSCQTVCLDFE